MGLFASLVDRASGITAKVTGSGALLVSAFGGAGEVREYLCRHLRNAAGSDSVTGNYAGNPTEFFVRPPAGEVWRISRLLVIVEDSKINADDYGAIAGGISPGMELYVADDNGIINHLMDNGDISSNAEWAEYCYDADAKFWGVGNEFLVVRWTFTKAGVPLRLRGSHRERLAILAQADLTGLVEHEYIVQGYKE